MSDRTPSAATPSWRRWWDVLMVRAGAVEAWFKWGQQALDALLYRKDDEDA